MQINKIGKEDKCIDRQIGKLLAEYTMIMLAFNVFKRVFELNQIMQIGFFGILVIGLGVSNFPIFIKVIQKCIAYIMLFEMVALCIYIISYLKGDSKPSTLIVYIAFTCCLCIPIMMIGTLVQDKKVVYEKVKELSPYVVIIGSFIFLAYGKEVYNMQYSYRMMVPLLVYTNEFLKSKRWKDLIIALYIFAMVIMFGSRGPLLCFGIFVILRLYTCKGDCFLKGIVAVVAAAFIIFYEQIGSWVLSVLESLGINNRTLTLIFTNIFYVSGRNDLQEEAMELLKENWLFGRGVASDINLIGQYPHNIFIEILYDYGYIIGTVILVVFVGLLLRFFFGKNREVVLFFLAICVFPLLISGTYLKEPLLFFLLGMIWNEIKVSKFDRIYGKWKRKQDLVMY